MGEKTSYTTMEKATAHSQSEYGDFLYDAKYIDNILTHYPEAKQQMNQHGILFFRKDKELVGAVAPLNPENLEFPTAYQARRIREIHGESAAPTKKKAPEQAQASAAGSARYQTLPPEKSLPQSGKKPKTEAMTSERGKGDITTGQTPQTPEGGIFEVENISIDSLQKTHPAAVEADYVSERHEGAIDEPIIISRDTNEILNGHARVLAKEQAGEKTVGTIRVSLSNQDLIENNWTNDDVSVAVLAAEGTQPKRLKTDFLEADSSEGNVLEILQTLYERGDVTREQAHSAVNALNKIHPKGQISQKELEYYPEFHKLPEK